MGHSCRAPRSCGASTFSAQAHRYRVVWRSCCSFLFSTASCHGGEGRVFLECENAKHWHDEDQREHWVGSGLPVAEREFRRIKESRTFPIFDIF